MSDLIVEHPPPDWTPLRYDCVAPLEYVGGRMTDPLSGRVIPKSPIQNLEWRQRVLEQAEDDEEFREMLRKSLSGSVILFANLLGWIECEKEHLSDGGHKPTEWHHRPYISWPCQDREMALTQKTVDEGGRIRRKKCREVGDTWMQVMIDCWLFVCRPDIKILCMSHSEDEVWDGRNTDTIMGKHLYVLDPNVPDVSPVPSWLMPEPPTVKKLSIVNKHNNSRINGRATRGTIGRGGRAKRVWVDEAAHIERLKQLEGSMFENPTSITYLSSVMPGTHFAELATDPNYIQRSIMWYEHPEKGADRYIVEDPATGNREWASPWQQARVESMDPFIYATEVAADERFGGTLAFDTFMLDAHRKKHAERPEVRTVEGAVVWSRDSEGQPTALPNTMAGGDDILVEGRDDLMRFIEGYNPRYVRIFEDHSLHPDGTGRVTFALERCPRTGGPRPPQDRRYAVACDIGEGLGRANSTMSIGDIARGVKIGEVAVPDYEPHDFARLMVAVSLWVGGVDNTMPVLVWERNGPGESIYQHVYERYRYPNCWRSENHGSIVKRKKQTLGFYSTQNTKPALISSYANALSSEKFINPSIPAIQECASFIRKGNRIIQGTFSDTESAAEAAHGDRTIADALLHMVMEDATPSQRKTKVRRSAKMTHADLEEMIERQDRQDRYARRRARSRHRPRRY